MKAFHPYTLRKIHRMALTLENKNVELVKENNFLFMSLVRIIVYNVIFRMLLLNDVDA